MCCVLYPVWCTYFSILRYSKKLGYHPLLLWPCFFFSSIFTVDIENIRLPKMNVIEDKRNIPTPFQEVEEKKREVGRSERDCGSDKSLFLLSPPPPLLSFKGEWQGDPSPKTSISFFQRLLSSVATGANFFSYAVRFKKSPQAKRNAYWENLALANFCQLRGNTVSSFPSLSLSLPKHRTIRTPSNIWFTCEKVDLNLSETPCKMWLFLKRKSFLSEILSFFLGREKKCYFGLFDSSSLLCVCLMIERFGDVAQSLQS